MKAIILAGGSGTRLWPLSRKNYPKQFLRLDGNRSLLQQTADRLRGVVPDEDIIIMTNNTYRFYVKEDLREISNIILEPAGKNTAPAIALGMKYCLERLGGSEEDIIFISPSDHVIRPVDRFAEHLQRIPEIARKGHIVTFGIKPDRPETGYGYIRVGAWEGDCYKVEQFTEKPDRATAIRYVDDSQYYWNSGMFAFSIGTMLKEMEKSAPAIRAMLDKSFDEIIETFDQMPDISIDYAVMEKAEHVVMIPLDVYWNDIGSWDALYDVLEKDDQGNVTRGDVLPIDTKGTLILGSKRHISTIGLEDCLVIETDDAILIAKKGAAQKVKDVVATLKGASRPEADEHVTTYRPWGSYTILEEGPRYKIKRIVVKPKEKLSLQMHYHRSEHWVVIKGTAKVTISDREELVHENESVYVPQSTLHRLENPGKVPLEIIEVQNGEYVGEDDILRVEDNYGRDKDQR